jgi:hypothetical protein|tara:strand:+ start:5690 stop:6157 length:468 start_codon:yes stop_codon:yes gene_type:complete
MKWLKAKIEILACLLLVACGTQSEQSTIEPAATGSTYQMMTEYLEPAADKIWDSAGAIITIEGEQDLQPTTDEGWAAVVHSASVVAEGGNLLMLKGYAADQADWLEYAQGLTRAALKARQAALDQDDEALFNAGGEIYNVCRACHNKYIVEAGEI